MKPKVTQRDQFNLFHAHFNQILNLDHELCRLANAIDWSGFDAHFADCYSADMGRVVRDIGRKAVEMDSQLQEFLHRAEKLLVQIKKSKNYRYSIDASEVECISKGKAHKRYEFGCKVSVAVTNESNWVVGIGALHGNPYDGHTLAGAIEQVERITGKAVKEAFVDKGYRGHDYTGDGQVHMTGHRDQKPVIISCKAYLY